MESTFTSCIYSFIIWALSKWRMDWGLFEMSLEMNWAHGLCIYWFGCWCIVDSDTFGVQPLWLIFTSVQSDRKRTHIRILTNKQKGLKSLYIECKICFMHTQTQIHIPLAPTFTREKCIPLLLSSSYHQERWALLHHCLLFFFLYKNPQLSCT